MSFSRTPSSALSCDRSLNSTSSLKVRRGLRKLELCAEWQNREALLMLQQEINRFLRENGD
jgi:hypothetical protein